MQVNLSPIPGNGSGLGRAGTLFLSQLMKLTGSSTQALREQRDERQRRADEDPRLLAGGIAGRGPTQAIQDDERRMRPTSHAARRQVQSQLDQKAAQQRHVFDRTLADATARETDRGAGRVRPGAAEPGGKEPASRGGRADSPAKDAGGNAATRSRAEAPRTSGPPDVGHLPSPRSPGARAGAAPTAEVKGQGGARAAARPSTAAPVAGVSRSAAARGVASSPTAGKPGAVGANQPAGGAAAATLQKGASDKASLSGTRAARGGPAQPGKSDANVQRILRVVRSQITHDRARATLRLDPPELGRIKLQLDLRQDVLSLRIDTQNGAARRLLLEHVESLRQGLEAAGVQLERVEIRAPAALTQPDQSDLPPEPDAQRGERDAATDADAEHPAERGMESSPAPADDTAGREPIPEPAAESLVNILA